MLTRRTNLLLSEPDYQKLNQLAGRQGVSVGELIRKTLKKTVLTNGGVKPNDIAGQIKKGWKLLKNPEQPLNYKQLIEDGRKY